MHASDHSRDRCAELPTMRLGQDDAGQPAAPVNLAARLYVSLLCSFRQSSGYPSLPT